LCPSCSQNSPLTIEQTAIVDKILLSFPVKWKTSFENLLEKPYSLKTAVGCPDCGGDGYKGLTAIFELAFFDDSFAKYFGSPALIKEIAKNTISLKQDATIKLLRGIIDWQGFEGIE
jgi:type II secretory ATPase GspE/PulE/Tfp pilus assembly ATPase PilB-like protein